MCIKQSPLILFLCVQLLPPAAYKLNAKLAQLFSLNRVNTISPSFLLLNQLIKFSLFHCCLYLLQCANQLWLTSQFKSILTLCQCLWLAAIEGDELDGAIGFHTPPTLDTFTTLNESHLTFTVSNALGFGRLIGTVLCQLYLLSQLGLTTCVDDEGVNCVGCL